MKFFQGFGFTANSRRLLAWLIFALFALSACGSGGSGGSSSDNGLLSDDLQSEDQPNGEPDSGASGEQMSSVMLTVEMPDRVQRLSSTNVSVVATIAGGNHLMNRQSGGTGTELQVSLPTGHEYLAYIAIRRSDDELLLATAEVDIKTDSADVTLRVPGYVFSYEYDDDSDGFLNITEVERGSAPIEVSEDHDGDGLANVTDDDDDNDGVIDLEDPQPYNSNVTGWEDTDGDGVRDVEDAFVYDASESSDADGDGIGDNEDPDDDNNGIPDYQENAIAVIPYHATAPTIDGAWGWREWQGAAYTDNKGNYLYIDHLMIDETGQHENLSWSNYSRWFAKHDGTWLYMFIIVHPEPSVERFNDSDNLWDDDSAEIYIDVGNEKSTSYDDNDFQRLFRFKEDDPDNIVDGYHSASGMETNYSTSRVSQLTNNYYYSSRYAYYEIRVRLSSIGLSEGSKFGLDVQYNDDEDGGSRDSKWGWWSKPYQDSSWYDPSQFGTAILGSRSGVVE